MSQEQLLLDDENLFDKEEFLRLVPTLKNTLFWNRATTIILSIITIILFIIWCLITINIMYAGELILFLFLAGFTTLTVTTGWLTFRFFRTGQSIQGYLVSHEEKDLELSLTQQAFGWQAFGISMFLWAVIGIGGMTSFIFTLNFSEMEEAAAVQEATVESSMIIVDSLDSSEIESDSSSLSSE